MIKLIVFALILMNQRAHNLKHGYSLAKTLCIFHFTHTTLCLSLATIHIQILFFLNPPPPSLMNEHAPVHAWKLESDIHRVHQTRILNCGSAAALIGIQSWLLVRCAAPGYKNHSNSAQTRISHFVLFPGTNILIHMYTHTRTQA